MDLVKKKDGAIDIFEINGKLDVTGSQQAQETIVPIIPKDGKLIIDMANVDYVASSGLRILLILAKQSQILNCKTVIAGVQPLVWDVIVMTGFEDVLESFPSQADALVALKNE
jgi:anti-anti-sigma factor